MLPSMVSYLDPFHNYFGFFTTIIPFSPPSSLLSTKKYLRHAKCVGTGGATSLHQRRRLVGIVFEMASPKQSQSSCQKLFIVSLLFLSFSLVFLAFSFKPKPRQSVGNEARWLQSNYHHYNIRNSTAVAPPQKWFDLVARKLGGHGKIKIGLVNVEDRVKHAYNVHGLVETVNVEFDRVSEDNLSWKDFFPEWIDEEEKWGPQSCPAVPMPRLEGYHDLDVVVARVPCGGGRGKEREGIREVFRLQVNLVVANLVVANGLKSDRTVYVVFMGSCGPMKEIFRCEDLVSHVGDHWVYKPELRKLKQKVLMPVGSCQIAPPYAETGKEVWRHYMSQSALNKINDTTYLRRPKVAYATVLHSSEAYVCGAIALAQSIIQTGSKKDLVLLHDSSISAKSLHGLRASGWKTRLIQPIRSPFAKKDSYNEWNYSKLRIWQLLDYDKVIFIDADIVILKNIDKFFVYPQLSASGNDKTLFNSGLMVIEPSACTFEHLMSMTTKLASYNGGDQGFLNEVFTWWHRLPSKLNYMKIFFDTSSASKERLDHKIKNNLYGIHYLGLKPWLCYKDYDCNWDMMDHHIFASDSAHKKWWKVHDAMPKKLQNYCKLTKRMDARIRKWRGIARTSNLTNGHWQIRVKDPRQHQLL